MAVVKVHYDGWIALPAVMRRKLKLATDDALTVELVDGAIVIRPVAGATEPTASEPELPSTLPAVTASEPETTATPVKRRPGRPRKAESKSAPSDGFQAELRRKVALPTPGRAAARGRRPKPAVSGAGPG